MGKLFYPIFCAAFTRHRKRYIACGDFLKITGALIPLRLPFRKKSRDGSQERLVLCALSSRNKEAASSQAPRIRRRKIQTARP